MEQSYFVNGAFGVPGIPGVGISDQIWGISVTQYAGVVNGLISSSSIVIDYAGAFLSVYDGLSMDAGFGVGIGTTKFISPYDPMIHGQTNYVSASFGIDPLEVVDVGIGITSSIALKDEVDLYIDYGTNKVQTPRLFLDILLGSHNIWPNFMPFIASQSDDLDRICWARRAYAAIQAWNYAIAYEELRYK
jgi:hypothetical protein